jgi:hypothetical protein
MKGMYTLINKIAQAVENRRKWRLTDSGKAYKEETLKEK